MSAHRTSSARVIARPRSRQGKIRCSGLAAPVPGRRCVASIPIRRMGRRIRIPDTTLLFAVVSPARISGALPMKRRFQGPTESSAVRPRDLPRRLVARQDLRHHLRLQLGRLPPSRHLHLLRARQARSRAASLPGVNSTIAGCSGSGGHIPRMKTGDCRWLWRDPRGARREETSVRRGRGDAGQGRLRRTGSGARGSGRGRPDPAPHLGSGRLSKVGVPSLGAPRPPRAAKRMPRCRVGLGRARRTTGFRPARRARIFRHSAVARSISGLAGGAGPEGRSGSLGLVEAGGRAGRRVSFPLIG